MSLTPPDFPPGSSNGQDDPPRLLTRTERAVPPQGELRDNIFDRVNRARREHTPRPHKLNASTRRIL